MSDIDERFSVTEARVVLGYLATRISHTDERIVLQRHGKDVAVLISLGDLRYLEMLEDHFDLQRAHAALAEPGPDVSWEVVKAAING